MIGLQRNLDRVSGGLKLGIAKQATFSHTQILDSKRCSFPFLDNTDHRGLILFSRFFYMLHCLLPTELFLLNHTKRHFPDFLFPAEMPPNVPGSTLPVGFGPAPH